MSVTRRREPFLTVRNHPASGRMAVASARSYIVAARRNEVESRPVQAAAPTDPAETMSAPNSLFATLTPVVEGNHALRAPQVEAFVALRQLFQSGSTQRNAGVVLPVGCGKSGLITIAPFALRARRVLVVAPGTRIAAQLYSDFSWNSPTFFYKRCAILSGPPYPEPVDIRGSASNLVDLAEADVVVTNIQQLQREGLENKWLVDLPSDFFDVIIFDEGHHNRAESWLMLQGKFPAARVISLSATPLRADGKPMAGEIVYTYPIHRAMQAGYVKTVKGIVLNPATLRYVRNEDGVEVEVDLDTVRRLGEQDASFRRSIVSSKETLDTIVDASITQLEKLRDSTGEPRLKIIASALNMEHCKQVVRAFRERGQRADYVHSRLASQANDAVLAKLDRHELDVIVQVRMLGEGFDHKHLTVAAVFSVFANLSPFVQFVGRIMRVLEEGAPDHPTNQGIVVFHAGANTARVWSDFSEFAAADQEWFKLLTEHELIGGEAVREVDPTAEMTRDADSSLVRITEPGVVTLQEMPLLLKEKLQTYLEDLLSAGLTAEDIGKAAETLQRLPVAKIDRRRASKAALDELIRTRAGQMVLSRGLSPEGRELDGGRLGRSNWVVCKAALDRKVNEHVDRGSSERDRFTQAELDRIASDFERLAQEACTEVFGG